MFYINLSWPALLNFPKTSAVQNVTGRALENLLLVYRFINTLSITVLLRPIHTDEFGKKS